MRINLKLLCLASALIGSAVISTSALAIGGVNLQPSYYNGGNVNVGWALMAANPKIKAVRIEIDRGAFNFNLSAHTRIIDEALSRSNIQKVIITYHDSTCLGCSDGTKLNAAANFFKNNQTALRLSNAKIRINLFNEWGGHNLAGVTWGNNINNAIGIIRNAGINRTIIVDAPGLGQGAVRAAAGLKQVTHSAVVPSMHIYQSCYDEGSKSDADLIAAGLTPADKGTGLGECLPKYMNALVAAGRGMVMGEFGTRHPKPEDNASINTYKGLITHGRGLGDIYAWAWNGDGERSNMVQPTWKNNPTAAESAFIKAGYFAEVYSYLP